jgi:hypothetical protein
VDLVEGRAPASPNEPGPLQAGQATRFLLGPTRSDHGLQTRHRSTPVHDHDGLTVPHPIEQCTERVSRLGYCGGLHDAIIAFLLRNAWRDIDSFNKGDSAAAAATHAATADLAIIDEVPPHIWRGSQAFQAWSADLESDAKKRGITDMVVTISSPTREERTGDHAYVVVPAKYAFKERGVAMSETAQMAFALKKGASGWLIHGWTWTGPRPKPVGPAKP